MLEESLFHWFHCNMFQISHRSRPCSHKHLQGRWTNTAIIKPNRTYLPQLILTPTLGHGKTAKKRKLICDGNKLINNNANEWQPDNIHFIKELLLVLAIFTKNSKLSMYFILANSCNTCANSCEFMQNLCEFVRVQAKFVQIRTNSCKIGVNSHKFKQNISNIFILVSPKFEKIF